MGDPYADGHGRTHRVNIRSNLSVPAIQTAYKRGTELLGVDFSEDVCRGYEENRMDDDVYEKLVLLGMPVDEIFGEGFQEERASADGVYLDYDTYWLIWLFIVKLGEPSFVWKQSLKGSNVNIRGYGLFSG